MNLWHSPWCSVHLGHSVLRTFQNNASSVIDNCSTGSFCAAPEHGKLLVVIATYFCDC